MATKQKKSLPAKSGRSKPNEPRALHVSDGETHLVALKSVRVLLTPDDDQWFAQGLEIDYASAGATIEEAKRNFEDGLSRTIREHLRMVGDIKKLLTPAPPEAWEEFLQAPPNALRQSYSTVEAYEILSDENLGENVFPFDQLLFIERKQANAG
jgi:hypothetical protein